MLRCAREIEHAGDALRLPRFLFLLGELSACLGEAGDAARGLLTVDQVIARCEDSGERWYLAEAWRIKGELVLLDGASDERAEEHLRQLTRAGAGTAGARVGASRRDRPGEAAVAARGVSRRRMMIWPRCYGAFTEGFATADVQAARALLQALG